MSEASPQLHELLQGQEVEPPVHLFPLTVGFVDTSDTTQADPRAISTDFPPLAEQLPLPSRKRLAQEKVDLDTLQPVLKGQERWSILSSDAQRILGNEPPTHADLPQGTTAMVTPATDTLTGREVVVKWFKQPPEIPLEPAPNDTTKPWHRRLSRKLMNILNPSLETPPKISLSPEERLRLFYKEKGRLARVNHPNVARILDFLVLPSKTETGETQLIPGLVLEKLDPLWTLPNMYDPDPISRTRKSQSRVAGIVTHIAAALDHIYTEHGMVHGDISKNNIMIRREDSATDPTYVLIDLGGAADEENGISGFSPAYGEPQLFDIKNSVHEPFPERIDQHALAAVAYELLTDQLPFTYLADGTMHTGHTSPKQVLPRHPVLTEYMYQVLAKALSFNRRDRYPSCTAFANALKAAFAHAQSQKRSFLST